MSKKLRRVDTAQFKQALKAGVEHVKNLLVTKFSTTEVKKIDEAAITLDMVISTQTVDRDGDTLAVNGWKLDDYRKNPVVLWAHNRDCDRPPIAKSIDVHVEGGKLVATAQFIPRDTPALGDFAFAIFQLFKGGFLNACSVGFQPMKWQDASNLPDRGNAWAPVDFLEQSLLEWSPCPVPANPDALARAKSIGIDTRPLVEWAEKLLDGDAASLLVPREYVEQFRSKAEPASPVTVQVPASIEPATTETKTLTEPTAAAVVAPTPAEPATAEAASLPTTATASLDMPELIKQLEAHTDKAVDTALKAANDTVTLIKQGRVLSAANEDKLRQARDLLSGVISQVEAEPEEEAATVEPKNADPFRLVVNEPTPPIATEEVPKVGVSQEKLAHLLKETVRESVEASIRRAMGRVD